MNGSGSYPGRSPLRLVVWDLLDVFREVTNHLDESERSGAELAETAHEPLRCLLLVQQVLDAFPKLQNVALRCLVIELHPAPRRFDRVEPPPERFLRFRDPLLPRHDLPQIDELVTLDLRL
jgi:hypothetical protein